MNLAARNARARERADQKRAAATLASVMSHPVPAAPATVAMDDAALQRWVERLQPFIAEAQEQGITDPVQQLAHAVRRDNALCLEMLQTISSSYGGRPSARAQQALSRLSWRAWLQLKQQELGAAVRLESLRMEVGHG